MSDFRSMRVVDFTRGYYCAVAALLREEGCVTPTVRMLYGAGGSPADADPEDAELFAAHGLLPNAQVTGTKGHASTCKDR